MNLYQLLKEDFRWLDVKRTVNLKKRGCQRHPLFRTQGRDRTGTSVTSSVFETDASTNSAT